MNEKIKELALQAGGSHYPEVGGKVLEAYTRLVAEECIKIAVKHGSPRTAAEIELTFKSQ